MMKQQAVPKTKKKKKQQAVPTPQTKNCDLEPTRGLEKSNKYKSQTKKQQKKGEEPEKDPI